MNNKLVWDAAGKAAAMRDLCAKGIQEGTEESEIMAEPAAASRV